MIGQMKIKTFIAIIFISLCFQTTFGQSCGGGNSYFHVFDENGLIEIKDFYFNLHIVSEDQLWRGKDFSKYGWKQQIFDKATRKKYKDPKTHEYLEDAFEIPAKEQSRLIENWIKLSEKNPDSIFAKDKDRCDNWLQGSSDTRQKPINVCTIEGCGWMVLLEIQAKGYETAYFVSDFLCGCTKHYEFRLKRKRDKCLPRCGKNEPFKTDFRSSLIPNFRFFRNAIFP